MNVQEKNPAGGNQNQNQNKAPALFDAIAISVASPSKFFRGLTEK